MAALVVYPPKRTDTSVAGTRLAMRVPSRVAQPKEHNMDRKLLDCGHRQPAKDGNGCAWCPMCGTLAIVVEERALVGSARR